MQVHCFDYWRDQLQVTEDADELRSLRYSLVRNRFWLYAEIKQIFGEGFLIKCFCLQTTFKELIKVCVEFERRSKLIERAIDEKIKFKNGLSKARVRRFDRFVADEAGDACGVCLDDVEVGREMTRLDCGGSHVFCRDCIERWLMNHNTCPYCNHVFSN